MQKFTVFTVLLTIVVVVIAAETFVNKYLPALDSASDGGQAAAQEQDGYNLPSELDLSAAMQANVLGVDGVASGTNVPTVQEPIDTGSQSEGLDFLNLDFSGTGSGIGEPVGGGLNELTVPKSSGTFDIEDFSGSYEHSSDQVSYVRNDQVVNSGFVGAYLTEEDPDGMLYKSVNIGDLVGVSSKKYSITNGTTTFSKIYVVIIDDPLQVGGVYDVLKTRAAEGVDIEINETNQFGSASFYMNDLRRDSVAFLTVRVGSRIYGFSYPKQYHPQVKNLVSILMLDGR